MPSQEYFYTGDVEIFSAVGKQNIRARISGAGRRGDDAGAFGGDGGGGGAYVFINDLSAPFKTQFIVYVGRGVGTVPEDTYIAAFPDPFDGIILGNTESDPISTPGFVKQDIYGWASVSQDGGSGGLAGSFSHGGGGGSAGSPSGANDGDDATAIAGGAGGIGIGPGIDNYGNGGHGATGLTPATAGTDFGGGGGGGSTLSPDGQAGASGYILIEWDVPGDSGSGQPNQVPQAMYVGM